LKIAFALIASVFSFNVETHVNDGTLLMGIMVAPGEPCPSLDDIRIVCGDNCNQLEAHGFDVNGVALGALGGLPPCQ
jgi:hypothetical protein